MATAEYPVTNGVEETRLRVVAGDPERFHRLREVRMQQGMSIRTVARRMGESMRTIREEEDDQTDLPLSRLFKWQEALEVPLEDLLCEPDSSLSRPVQERAKMIRAMKTVMSIRDIATEDTPLARLSSMLVEQMCDLMPELEDVSSWHTVGQRRSLDELGRIAEHPVNSSSYGNRVFDD